MANMRALGIVQRPVASIQVLNSAPTHQRLRIPQTLKRPSNIVCLAKKATGSRPASESQLSSQKQNETIEDDAILSGLNELANDALQVMLGNKKSKSLMDCLEDLDEAGEYLVKEGKLEAARFVLVIKHMLDHQVIPESNELEGPYKKAFEKIWGCVEDSGWALAMPKNETGVDLLDDELIPPVLSQIQS